jgi:hypothetical protein
MCTSSPHHRDVRASRRHGGPDHSTDRDHLPPDGRGSAFQRWPRLIGPNKASCSPRSQPSASRAMLPNPPRAAPGRFAPRVEPLRPARSPSGRWVIGELSPTPRSHRHATPPVLLRSRWPGCAQRSPTNVCFEEPVNDTGTAFQQVDREVVFRVDPELRQEPWLCQFDLRLELTFDSRHGTPAPSLLGRSSTRSVLRRHSRGRRYHPRYAPPSCP